MSMELALQTYIAESRGLLQEMEEALLSLERSPADPQLIDALFRAAHTIKGSAGLFGLDNVVAFVHVVENVLERLRSGEIASSKTLIGVMLACADHMALLIDSVAERNGMLAGSQVEQGHELLQRLQPFLAEHAPGEAHAGGLADADGHAGPEKTGTHGAKQWQVAVQFGEDVLRMGMDPLSFIRYLGTLGDVSGVSVDPARLPDFERADPEANYLGFQLQVAGIEDRQTIEDVFEFVREDSRLSIEPVARVESRSATASENRQADTKALPAKQARFIRVNAEKLDQLINLIGELVIAGASGSMLARRHGDPALQEASAAINHYIEHIRESALGLRMVEIGETFKRFQRVVRDVSQELGKDISLEILGADTELDKTVVEQIGDPLTHLVRNAIDHGIESAQLRAARGKPVQGVVRLNAFHDSGNIVIEISDDGGGLNVARIRQKAIERGLIKETDTLSEREVCHLIFESGFSTAEVVTNLSGRGVGMDVVRRNIEALRGSVDIDSTEGEGTTVRVRLPLTLAIIDGFLVAVGESSYVVPLDAVLECIEISHDMVDAQAGRGYFNLRGEVLPFMRLRDQFGITDRPPRRENVVVVQSASHKVGLVVDELMGEFQTVIKPLGKIFNNVRGISGSTILGSGEVGLILFVPSLVSLAIDGERLQETIHLSAERH